jgi:cytochrome c peroxidase
MLRSMNDETIKSFVAVAAGLLATALLTGALCGAELRSQDDADLYTPSQLAAIFAHSPIPKLSPDPTDRVADDPHAAAFGQFIFFDASFSPNGRVSCESCHQPARGFTDGRRLAQGLMAGTRHTPTVLNAAHNHWYFWDGRADSEWSQALQPFENPREMGTDRLHVVHEIAGDPALRDAYRQIFGALPPLSGTQRFPLDARPDVDAQSPLALAWARMTVQDRFAVNRAYSNVGKAIEAYERELVGGTSPFDRYVAALRSHNVAQERVLSPQAKRGLLLFVGTANCELCHSGPEFTDGQFHNLGMPVVPGAAPDRGRADGIRLVLANPFNAAGPFSDDPNGAGKAQLTYLPSPDSELGAFKTPSLRNVAIDGPYAHDGRFATLAQVLDFYAKGAAASRGRLVGKREETANLVPRLTEQQQADLVAFLKTLTDAPLPPSLTRQPTQP